MDVVKKRRFRFGLRTLLLVVAVAAALCAVASRRTDPMLVRKGMSRATVWWHCGWPAMRKTYEVTERTRWIYPADLPGTEANCLDVHFVGGSVIGAWLIKADGMPCPKTFDNLADNE